MKTLNIKSLVFMATLVAFGNAWAMEGATGKKLQEAFKQALSDRNVPEIKKLLQAGADPNAKIGRDCQYALPYDYIYPNIVQDRHKALTNALHLATALVDAGANLNKANRNGDNALSIVAKIYKTRKDLHNPENGAIIMAIANLMLLHGADPKHQTYFGITPLHHAAENGNLDLIKLLIEKGANVNAGAKENNTPLLSVVKGNVDIKPHFKKIMNLLLGNDADPNIKDSSDRNILDHLTDRLQEVYDQRIKEKLKK